MTADLYIRVSTDEQADKGYSQRDQEERLKKYCENNQINVPAGWCLKTILRNRLTGHSGMIFL